MKAVRAVVIALPLAADLGHGGHAWAMLNWVLGFERCGHDVHVVEPRQSGTPDLTPADVAAAGDLLRRHGFSGSFTVTGPDAAWTAGDRSPAQLRHLVADGDVLVNLSGVWRDGLSRCFPHRVFVDLDPGFTQIWAAQGIDVGLGGHTAYVTVGLDVGRPSALLPADGLDWIPTLPPVVMEHWQTDGMPVGPYTTVANWRSYGAAHHRGVRHGQKAHSFRDLLSLPGRVAVPIEVALRIHPGEIDDLRALDDAGWCRVDPGTTTASPEDYREFVHRSRGEIGIAKEGYVVARTGWISDRTACFLAAGRPVVIQDTGGVHLLPDCDGFIRFRTVDDAIDGLHTVDRDWTGHSRGARALAEQRFAHDIVVPTLLEVAA